ncbi:MAG: hypothetical protein HYR63_13125 [Proteobacteria bacterium]|nr:hypothetical protein [Pseudomonadota bacterium]MBI3496961.1 hypothetical protein [Pseudomonadota bacterium]
MSAMAMNAPKIFVLIEPLIFMGESDIETVLALMPIAMAHGAIFRD